jgi:lipopolysaccharide/colanic/teichoic acid biosynthesis glycosyltransferase
MKGEMSLVGPRPEMPFIVESYSSVERQRLRVKPGITGLWQISPARAKPIHKNLDYDFFYIEHQNIILDCIILLRTLTAVIRGIGAA